jgi:hypothetical protein
MKLIEGTHYMRREEQPTPTQLKSKEAIIDRLVCDDPGDDTNERVARKDLGQLGKIFALAGFTNT